MRPPAEAKALLQRLLKRVTVHQTEDGLKLDFAFRE
jgi:hypothetical protein